MTPDALWYCRDPALLKPGNGLSVFGRGDDAFACMLDAIRSARQEVELETYILSADRTGAEFHQALSERARAGVRVRLMVDGFGSSTLPDEYLGTLQEAGVETLVYHPLGPWHPRWGWRRRNHRKILVVDRWRGFTGGLNVADEYRSATSGGGGWRDVHLEVVGPVAADLHRLFADAWHRERGGPVPAGLEPDPELEASAARRRAELGGGGTAQALGNHRLRLRGVIRKSYLHAITQARERIVLANAYFVPDQAVRRALQAAARRGVDVQVLVAARTDVAPVYYAARATFQSLLSAGVGLYEMGGAVLHAKAAVVDDRWGIVGSYNFDHRSLFHNLEATVTMVDRAAAKRLAEVLADHRSLCSRIDPATWHLRPWTQKLAERFWYLLRELL